MEWALFDWPIVLQYDVKAKYQLISRNFFGHEVFSAERSLNHPKAKCVRIRSIFVRLLFLFCSYIFISKSYENRSSISVCKLPGISRTCNFREVSGPVRTQWPIEYNYLKFVIHHFHIEHNVPCLSPPPQTFA